MPWPAAAGRRGGLVTEMDRDRRELKMTFRVAVMKRPLSSDLSSGTCLKSQDVLWTLNAHWYEHSGTVSADGYISYDFTSNIRLEVVWARRTCQHSISC